MKVGFVISLDAGGTTVGRHIEASGNTITVSPASAIGIGNYAASQCELIVFMERA
jgi:hypothetical protein